MKSSTIKKSEFSNRETLEKVSTPIWMRVLGWRSYGVDSLLDEIRRHIKNEAMKLVINDGRKLSVVFDFDQTLSYGCGGNPVHKICSFYREVFFSETAVPVIITARTPRARSKIRAWFTQNNLPFKDETLFLRADPNTSTIAAKRAARHFSQTKLKLRIVASLGDQAADVTDCSAKCAYINSERASTGWFSDWFSERKSYRVSRNGYIGIVLPPYSAEDEVACPPFPPILFKDDVSLQETKGSLLAVEVELEEGEVRVEDDVDAGGERGGQSPSSLKMVASRL